MKKIILFNILALMMLTSVIAAGSWNNIYTENFESGVNGNPYACEYIMHGQPNCQDWLYSSDAFDGVLSVGFSCYTDSMCALPVNIDFQNKEYKITFSAKHSSTAGNWLGIGMSDYAGTGVVDYTGHYMMWSSLVSYSDAKILAQSGLYESPTSTFTSGVPVLGTSWRYHEVYINSSCVNHYIYDAQGGNLLLSAECLNGALPSQLNNKELALFIAQQGGVTTTFDDVVVSEWVPCVPDWSCNGYEACQTTDTRACNSVEDLNTCGESYTGDYTEFTPLACDYCTPSWSCSSYSECMRNPRPVHRDCLTVVDANNCYSQTSLGSDQFGGNLATYKDTTCKIESSFGDSTTGRVVSTTSSSDNAFVRFWNAIMNIFRRK